MKVKCSSESSLVLIYRRNDINNPIGIINFY